jgi:hypothetical protein
MGLSQTWPAQVVGGEADPLYMAWEAARRARAVEWSACDAESWRQAFRHECLAMREALRQHISAEAAAGSEPHDGEHEELDAAVQRIVRDASMCRSREIAIVVELVERATLLEMKFAQHQNRLRYVDSPEPRPGTAASAAAHNAPGAAPRTATPNSLALAAVRTPGLPAIQR